MQTASATQRQARCSPPDQSSATRVVTVSNVLNVLNTVVRDSTVDGCVVAVVVLCKHCRTQLRTRSHLATSMVDQSRIVVSAIRKTVVVDKACSNLYENAVGSHQRLGGNQRARERVVREVYVVRQRQVQ